MCIRDRVIDAVVVGVKLILRTSYGVDRRACIGVGALVVIVPNTVAVAIVEQRATLSGASCKGGGSIGHARLKVAFVTVHTPDVVSETVAVRVGGLRGLEGESVVLVGASVAVGVRTTVQGDLDFVAVFVLLKTGS